MDMRNPGLGQKQGVPLIVRHFEDFHEQGDYHSEYRQNIWDEIRKISFTINHVNLVNRRLNRLVSLGRSYERNEFSESVKLTKYFGEPSKIL